MSSKQKLNHHKEELGLSGDSIRMNIFENVVPPMTQNYNLLIAHYKSNYFYFLSTL